MGWDAHSSVIMDEVIHQISDETYRKLFTKAAAEVRKITGSVDGFLSLGSLDCSDCCRMLEAATGESCYSDSGWDIKKVKQLAANSDWGIPYSEDQAWAYWSARKFLEVCAEGNLSITFSW